MKKKILMFFCISVFSVFSLCTPIFAKSYGDENLSVGYEIERSDNDCETIKISVKNISNDTLYNIDVKSELPNEFNFIDNKNMYIDKLGVNQEKILIRKFKFHSKGSMSESKNPETNVETGDQNNTYLIIFVFVISAGGLVILIKCKKGKKIFILVIISAIGLSTISTVQAKNNYITKKLSFIYTFDYDGSSYDLKTDISYEMINKDHVSDNYITRGEWINELVEEMDYAEFDFDLSNPYFTDTENSIVKDSINYAVAYKIVDLSSSAFKPNDYATREFIAVTTVRALGYQTTNELSCKDSFNLKYPKEDKVAIDIGVLSLKDDYFLPLDYITKNEANIALDVIAETKKSEFIGDNEFKNDVVYQDSVKKLSKTEVLSLNDTTLVVKNNEMTENINYEDIVAIDEYGVFEIKDKKIEKNQIVFTTSTPNFENTIKSIDTVGKGEMQLSEFEPAEGVEFRFYDSEDKGNKESKASMSKKFDFKKEINDNVTLTGNMNLDLDSVKYKADIDVSLLHGIDINNVYFKIEPDIDAEVKVSVEDEGNTNFDDEGYIELGSIPVVGIPGADIAVEVGVEYSASGYARVIYTLDGQYGIQILNNRPRIINSFSSTLSVEVNADLRFGPYLATKVEILNTWDLIDLSISAGASGNGTAAIRSTGIVCSDLKAHLYLQLDALQDCLLGDLFDTSFSKNIWEQKNSPIKYDGHFENFEKVDECTFEKAVINGNVVDVETKKPLDKVKIVIIDTDTDEKKTVYSNTNGEYKISVAGGSTYDIIFSKEGYGKHSEIIDLSPHEVKKLTISLHKKEVSMLGKAGGIITNSKTKEPVSEVKLEIRKIDASNNDQPIDTYITDFAGRYYIDNLPLGNYKATLSKMGFVTSSFNIEVTEEGNLNQNSVIVPDEIEGVTNITLEEGKSYRIECIKDHKLNTYHVTDTLIEFYYDQHSESGPVIDDEGEKGDRSYRPMGKGDYIEIKIKKGKMDIFALRDEDVWEGIKVNFFDYFTIQEIDHAPVKKYKLKAGDTITMKYPYIGTQGTSVRYNVKGENVSGTLTKIDYYWHDKFGGEISREEESLRNTLNYWTTLDEDREHIYKITGGEVIIYMGYENAMKLNISSSVPPFEDGPTDIV